MSAWLEQFERLPYPDVDCTGRTIIVVGANVGLGKEAARHFVRLNASKVIMTVRTLARGASALHDIETSTHKPHIAELWELDLGSYASVQAFAARASALPRLDAVIANASIATQKYAQLEDNESTITVNVVSTFLLILLLLPTLRASAARWNIAPTVTVVSSAAHRWTRFAERESANIFEAINGETTANMEERYPLSKLLQLFAFREIAARLTESHSPIVMNAISPGLVNTELTRNAEGTVRIFMAVLKFFLGRTPEVGSRTLVHAATVGSESHGLYFRSCDIKRNDVSEFVLSEDGKKAQKKFWGELVAKLEKISPGVTANL